MKQIFTLLALILCLLLSNVNAQNLTSNPWQCWVPELYDGTETPKAAFAYTSSNSKLSKTITNTCRSYGIGNDKRGYIYYADEETSFIYCANPGTATTVSSFGFTSGGAKIVNPHSFKTIYIAATDKHYLIVSNVGASIPNGNSGSINTDGIVTILDVTNPAAMTFVKNIVVPSATATGSRATGMDIIQTAYTSAGTSLYIVVENLYPSGTTNRGGLITITNPLYTTPTISVFLTRYSSSNIIADPHSVLADAVNSRLYVSSSYSNSILSFTLTGTATYNTYKVADGDGNEPEGLHTMMLNKAGTLLYTGSTNDAGGNKAYTFTIQSDKTSVTAATINQTAKSAVLNYSGQTEGNVMGVNLLPDGSKLYAVLEKNGAAFNTAKIYDLNPTTLATNGTIKNKAGTADATFGYLDPHSYAFTLQDYGDAPATYGTASHFLSNDDYLQDRLRIGATIDGDSAVAYSANLDGDDTRATPKTDDEDGITSAISLASKGLYYGMTGTYNIDGILVKNTTSPSVTANLIGWIDFNHDGVFQSTEGASVSVPNGTTSVNLSWPIPSNVTTGAVFLRLRLSSDPGLTVSTPASAAFDGEVEDHKFPAPIPVGGTVFNDVNANTIFGTTGASGSGENAASVAVPLYAYLIIGGVIVDSSHVNATTGAYSFPNAPQNAGAATIAIGTNSLAPGTASTAINNIATAPPTGWSYTGSSSATTTNGASGALGITLGTTGVAYQNFGMQRLPESAVNNQVIGTNPGGTNNITVNSGWFVNSNVGTNPNTQDYDGGTVDKIRITSFPSNATSIKIGTTTYYPNAASIPAICPTASCLAWPGSGGVTITAPGGVPSEAISVDPIDGAISVGIPFVAIDNTGSEDPTPGSVTLAFTSILPIKLLSFVANPKANGVELNWVVATEINVATYEIEYSTNGLNFSSVGSKASTNSRNYIFIHTDPKQGLNYYRLKVTDIDGSISYSEVLKVNIRSVVGNVKIYPTPAVNSINITLTNRMISQSATISILSLEGKLVYQQTKAVLSQTETIDVSRLASGKYFVVIITNKDVINEQIQIIK